MGIVDHMSGNVAHVAVPLGNIWFLGKSRPNPLCMGEGVVVVLVWPGQTSTFGS